MAQRYGPVTADDPLGFRIVARLLQLAKAVGIAGMFWFGVFWFVNIFGMSACTAPQPQPENGRTFHLLASFGRGGHCNGYVKPWVGHTVHFVETVTLALAIVFIVLTIALVIARKIFGEKPEGPDLRA